MTNCHFWATLSASWDLPFGSNGLGHCIRFSGCYLAWWVISKRKSYKNNVYFFKLKNILQSDTLKNQSLLRIPLPFYKSFSPTLNFYMVNWPYKISWIPNKGTIQNIINPFERVKWLFWELGGFQFFAFQQM